MLVALKKGRVVVVMWYSCMDQNDGTFPPKALGYLEIPQVMLRKRRNYCNKVVCVSFVGEEKT
jgi:hypothetical protein